MNQGFVRAVRAGMAIFLGLAWVVLVAIGIFYSVKSGDDPSWLSGEGMKYFMPGLTALVGGLVATTFGVAEDSSNTSHTSSLSNLVAAQPLDQPGGSQLIGGFYIVAYLAFGAIAAIVWVVKGGEAVEYVRTLAPAWGGLALPIAISYFK